MATALELLSGASVSDGDKTLIISNDLRTISIPSTVKCLGVEYDDDVLRLNFKLPRYLGVTDLSVFAIRINYMNVKGEKDAYTVKDASVGSDWITFSWLVGPTATRYKGNTSFNVCLKTLTSDGYADREYNTTIATLPVLEGLEVDEDVVTMYSDVLEQWRQELFGIGDTEEANIRAASQKEQENIAQKGVEVLGTIPEDYTTTFKMIDNADRTKADAIVCSAQGEIISVSDSSDDHLRGLKIFGKTTQTTTTGKNLLNIPSTINKIKGVFFKVNSDKSVTVTGTPTEVCAASIYGTYGEPIAFPAGTYIVSGGVDANHYIRVRIHSSDGTLTAMKYADGTSKEFTVNEGDLISVSIYFATLTLVNGMTFYPMIRLASIEDESYEPYSGGVASPSPDWSQELVSLGADTGTVETEIYGKNLLGQNGNYKSTYSSYVLNATIENGVVTVSGSSMLGYGTLQVSLPLGVFKKGYTYRISRVSKNFHIGFWFYDKNNVNIGSLTTENSSPITIPENADHMSLFYAGLTPETTVNLTEKFMLNLGTEALPWEPYVESQSIVSTCPNGLSGIPVPTDGTYVDANGQQWVCDEIDFERRVYIQRIAALVLDGDNIRPYYATHSNGQPYIALYPSDIKYGSQVMSNRYAFSAINWSDSNNTLYGIGGAIIINDNRFTSADDAITAWATELPEVMYVLATPIETVLTAEEIEAFKQLYTNFPNTTILNDTGATMELTYNADTTTYLNNLPRATDAQVQAAVDAWLIAKYGAIAEEASF